MQATLKAGIRYGSTIHQANETIEGPPETIWYLAQQGYAELPEELKPQAEAYKAQQTEMLKAQIESLQKQISEVDLLFQPAASTPRLVGDAIPPPPPIPPVPEHHQASTNPGHTAHEHEHQSRWRKK